MQGVHTHAAEQHSPERRAVDKFHNSPDKAECHGEHAPPQRPEKFYLNIEETHDTGLLLDSEVRRYHPKTLPAQPFSDHRPSRTQAFLLKVNSPLKILPPNNGASHAPSAFLSIPPMMGVLNAMAARLCNLSPGTSHL